MAFHPLRFVHAANVCLDHQLQHTGFLPDTLRETARDATTIAFQRLVSVCIERHVDFLLLAGNTFVAQDQSLWALAKFREGFVSLAEHDIPVVVVPGTTDPLECWQSIPGLPENVILMDSRDSEPVSICRDSQPIATVQRAPLAAADCASKRTDETFAERGLIESSRHAPRDESHVTRSVTTTMLPPFGPCPARHGSGHANARPFAIGVATWPNGDRTIDREDLVPGGELTSRVDGSLRRGVTDSPVDYLAVLAGWNRFNSSGSGCFAHHPGSLQGTRPCETGPRGCTLVEVEARGITAAEFLSVAPVRWDRFEIDLHPSLDEHDIVCGMRELVRSVHIDTGVRLWLIEWAISATPFQEAQDTHGNPDGEAALPEDRVLDSLACDRLVKRLEEALEPPGNAVRLHRVRLNHPIGTVPLPGSTDRWEREFRQAILQAADPNDRIVGQCVERAAFIEPAIAERLHKLFAEVQARQIWQKAQEQGMSWLSALQRVA